MRLVVCEAPPEMDPGDEDWQKLAAKIKEHEPDVVLLNEMPFGQWLAAAPEPDESSLIASHQLHEEGVKHFHDLGARWLMGTRPTFEQGRSVNQAFVWEANRGLVPAHTKQFFPDEEGFYEARWFERGESHFRLADVHELKVGFLICTEVMFNEWARYYGRSGAHIIAVPRAAGRPSLRRWKTALSMAAIVSGCYVVSSNRAGFDSKGQEFGGCGWIFDPFGDLVAETSRENSVVSADLDIALVEQAQLDYPCYVKELAASAVER